MWYKMYNESLILPPGLGTWPPIFEFGSTKQFVVFLAYKSKSGSNIVPTGLEFVASITIDDNWQVPLPLADILENKMKFSYCFKKRNSIKENNT